MATGQLAEKLDTKPLTHADADLILRLYEIRREPLMRESRNIMNGKFWPKNAADVLEIMNTPDHAFNAAFRQTSSYWEMVYGFARHGIIDANFLVENNGEGLFLYAKIAPYLTEVRAQTSPTAFQNVKWIAEETSEGKRRFEMTSARIQKMAAGK